MNASRQDAGFTLVETLIAIVVLAIGVLGLAGSAAVMTRQMGGGSRLAKAAVVASARLETLRAQDCTTIANGSASQQGFSEAWTVTPVVRAVLVTETVTFWGERRQRTQTYTTMWSC
jgi:prepilin-type N-terminal cleavage/methylation domain-containing protein